MCGVFIAAVTETAAVGGEKTSYTRAELQRCEQVRVSHWSCVVLRERRHYLRATIEALLYQRVIAVRGCNYCDLGSVCIRTCTYSYMHVVTSVVLGLGWRRLSMPGLLVHVRRLARAGGACVETARCVAVQLPAVWKSVLHTAATDAASHTAHR